jgi:hypothetical protein
MYFIFRKSDGVVLYEAHTLGQYENEKTACLANEGGVEADYLYLTGISSTPPGMLATVSSDGEVEFVKHPTVVAMDAAKAITAGKLRALGLDDADINTLNLT